MDAIHAAIVDLLTEEQPMTNRQCFYRLVSSGLVGKTEGEYKQTVCRLLADMRLDGTIPFGWSADNTRWMRKPATYSSDEEALSARARFYRKQLWQNQAHYVEIWCEKDALAGVIYEVTEEFDVPLMVTKGYASLSYLHEAAEAIANQRKPAFLYYLGDHDPSGLNIPENVERRLRQFAPGAEIHFQRVAVTRDQIAKYRLQTRPTKTTDSRAARFEGESVELDAIPPPELRRIVRDCIEPHVNQEQLRIAHIAEESERESLKILARSARSHR